MTALRKHWIMVVMLIILAGALATVVNMASQVGQPFGGFFTSHSPLWLVPMKWFHWPIAFSLSPAFL